MGATKNICTMKDKGSVDQSTVTRWLNKFHLGCKNLNNQAKSDRSKTMVSKVTLLAIETNPGGSTQRVSGKLHISQSSVVHLLCNLGKNTWSCPIVPHISNSK